MKDEDMVARVAGSSRVWVGCGSGGGGVESRGEIRSSSRAPDAPNDVLPTTSEGKLFFQARYSGGSSHTRTRVPPSTNLAPRAVRIASIYSAKVADAVATASTLSSSQVEEQLCQVQASKLLVPIGPCPKFSALLYRPTYGLRRQVLFNAAHLMRGTFRANI
jgi:hypothetical protein